MRVWQAFMAAGLTMHAVGALAGFIWLGSLASLCWAACAVYTIRAMVGLDLSEAS